MDGYQSGHGWLQGQPRVERKSSKDERLDFAKHFIELVDLDGLRVLQLAPGIQDGLDIQGRDVPGIQAELFVRLGQITHLQIHVGQTAIQHVKRPLERGYRGEIRIRRKTDLRSRRESTSPLHDIQARIGDSARARRER